METVTSVATTFVRNEPTHVLTIQWFGHFLLFG